MAEVCFERVEIFTYLFWLKLSSIYVKRVEECYLVLRVKVAEINCTEMTSCDNSHGYLLQPTCHLTWAVNVGY